MSLSGLKKAAEADKKKDSPKLDADLAERIRKSRDLESKIIAATDSKEEPGIVVKKTDLVKSKNTSLLVHKETCDQLDKIAKKLKIKRTTLIKTIIDEA